MKEFSVTEFSLPAFRRYDEIMKSEWIRRIAKWDEAFCKQQQARNERALFGRWLNQFLARYGPGLFFVEMGLIILLIAVFRPLQLRSTVIDIGVAIGAAVLTKWMIDAIAVRVKRDRPFVTLGYQPLIFKDEKDPSFPSNHAGGAFALAVSLSMSFPQLSLLSYALALGITYSRLYTGLHYLSDTFVGGCIGAFIGFVCVSLARFLF